MNVDIESLACAGGEEPGVGKLHEYKSRYTQCMEIDIEETVYSETEGDGLCIMHECYDCSQCMETGEGGADYFDESEAEESDSQSECSYYMGYGAYTGEYEHLSEYELDQLTREGRLFTIKSNILYMETDANDITGAGAEQQRCTAHRGGHTRRAHPPAGQPAQPAPTLALSAPAPP